MQAAESVWPDLNLGLVPIVVGVTGHRFLREKDTEHLKGAVREIFERLSRDFPNSPLLLLTPLAQGADQLVAKIAIDAKARLVIAIPSPPDEYRRSFRSAQPPETEEDKARDLRSQQALETFNFWWSDDNPHVDRRIVMPAISDQPPLGKPLDPETRRNLQFALVGAFVARHSHFLIALWDGVENGDMGGANDVVHYRRSGRYLFDADLHKYLENLPEPYALPSSALEPGPTGPILHVVTPRETGERPAHAFQTIELAPLIYYRYRDYDPEEPDFASVRYFARMREIYTRVDEFNKDARAQAKRRVQTEKSRKEICPESEEGISPALANLGNCFALADSLALRHRRFTYAMLAAMIAVVFAAAIPFAAYTHLVAPYGWKWALALYAVFLGLADALYLVLRRTDSQNKFQDYRALAEGLRAQFYWLLAGLPNSGADHYLHKQKDELRWIRTAIGGWSLRTDSAKEGQLGAVRELWLERQADYFKRAMVRERGRLAACNGLGASFVLASIAGALGQVLRHPPQGVSSLLSFRYIGPYVAVIAVGLIFAVHSVYLLRDDIRDTEAGEWKRPAQSALWFLAGLALATLFIETLVCVAAPSECWARHLFPRPLRQWCLVHLGEPLTNYLLFKPMVMESHGWLVAGLGLTALAGALIHTYADKRAFALHYRQYKRMRETHARAGGAMERLLQQGDLKRAAAVLIELGKEALAEQGDWVILHRERPIDVPQAEGG